MKKKMKIQPRISRIHTNTDKHGYFCAGGAENFIFRSCEFVKFVVDSISIAFIFYPRNPRRIFFGSGYAGFGMETMLTGKWLYGFPEA